MIGSSSLKGYSALGGGSPFKRIQCKNSKPSFEVTSEAGVVGVVVLRAFASSPPVAQAK